MTAPTPVTVIGGYLGAGKTTLINQLLRQADGMRLAVLVNEFGALPIDEDLILARDGDVISIAGGCVCCAFGDNLVGALVDMIVAETPPDHIVIEASGVAMPGAIAAMVSLVAGAELAGLIVLADAETIQGRACDKYLGDTVLRQLAQADLVVLTKTDLVNRQSVDAVSNWLSTVAPKARIMSSENGTLSNAIILGAFDGSTAQKIQPDGAVTHGAAHESLSFAQVAPVETTALSNLLVAPEFGLVRAKGFVQDAHGDTISIQVVGCRARVEPALEPVRIGLVCIGLTRQLSREPLEKALQALGFKLSPE